MTATRQLVVAIIATAWCATIAAAADSRKPNCTGTFDFGNISDGLGTMNRNINADLVGLLEERSGCSFRLLSMPAKRVYRELEDGKLHMSGRFFQSEERDKFLWFAHIQRTKVLGWYRPDRLSKEKVQALTETPDLVIGVTAGFSHTAAIDALVERKRALHPSGIVEFQDRPSLYRGLINGRVDVVFLPMSVVEELGDMETGPKIEVDSVDFAPEEAGATGGIVLSKKMFDAENAGRWQNLIHDMCVDGSVLRVFQKYFRATKDDLACSMREE